MSLRPDVGCSQVLGPVPEGISSGKVLTCVICWSGYVLADLTRVPTLTERGLNDELPSIFAAKRT